MCLWAISSFFYRVNDSTLQLPPVSHRGKFLQNITSSGTELTPFALDHTYHFFSGMGRGTAFTRQGKFGWPDRFLPRIVPTRFSGRMTKKQIQQTATCRKDKQTLLIFSRVACVYSQHPGCCQILPSFISTVLWRCPRIYLFFFSLKTFNKLLKLPWEVLDLNSPN